VRAVLHTTNVYASSAGIEEDIGLLELLVEKGRHDEMMQELKTCLTVDLE
jgi:hypothetical protein